MSSPTARLKQAKDQITATVERRVEAMAEADVDEAAMAHLLGTLGAIREVLRQIAAAESDAAEHERRQYRLKVGLAKTGARSDTNRLKEALAEQQASIDALVASRDQLIDHLSTLTSRLRAG